MEPYKDEVLLLHYYTSFENVHSYSSKMRHFCGKWLKTEIKISSVICMFFSIKLCSVIAKQLVILKKNPIIF